MSVRHGSKKEFHTTATRKRLTGLQVVSAVLSFGLCILSIRQSMLMDSKQFRGATFEIPPVLPASEKRQTERPTTTSGLGTQPLDVPYRLDPLCPGCRHAKPNKNSKTCGFLIHQKLEQVLQQRLVSNQTLLEPQYPDVLLLESATLVGRRNLFCHAACLSSTCSIAATQSYWNSSLHEMKMYPYHRYDDVAPKIDRATIHYLSSVPPQNRLPLEEANNLHRYLDNPKNTYPNKLYLFEFNPSIVALPDNWELPPSICEKQHDCFDETNRPIYLASYRLGHRHRCAKATKSNWNSSYIAKMYGGRSGFQELDKHAMHKSNKLGLALLREDLSIVKDTVVDLSSIATQRNNGYWNFHNFEDFRLFAIQPNEQLLTKNGSVVLTSNIYVAPISLVPKEGYVQLHFAFAERQGFPVWIQNYSTCVLPNNKKAKNLLYFEDADGNLLMDYYPTGNPHPIYSVDLNQECKSPNYTETLVAGVTAKQRRKQPRHNTTLLPKQNFATIEEIILPALPPKKQLFAGESGSACCAHIQDPITHRNLLLGISHTKTSYPKSKLPSGVSSNIYFSRFYAFERTHPYMVIARSGIFCLGNPETQEQFENGPPGHALWNVSQNADPLRIVNEEFKCPRIHFAMSIIDKVEQGEVGTNYSTKVVISYGVNDCLSRFVEVDKRGIAAMLWGKPKKYL